MNTNTELEHGARGHGETPAEALDSLVAAALRAIDAVESLVAAAVRAVDAIKEDGCRGDGK